MYIFFSLNTAAVSQLTQHNHSSQHILPLILMKNQLLQKYEMPSSVHYDQHSKRLTFSRFSTGDAMYFCPVEMEKPEQKNKIDEAIKQIRIRNSNEKTSDKKKQKLPEDIFNRCLVRKTFGENEEIKCDHEAIPVIERVRSNNQLRITDQLCGYNNVGIYYSFQYDVSMGVHKITEFIFHMSNFKHPLTYSKSRKMYE